MIRIDLHKVPRPERSGYIAVLVAYVLVCGYFERFYDPATGWQLPNIPCMLFPMISELCPSGLGEQIAEDTQPKHYQLTPLYTYGRANGKKPCSCHIDVEMYGKPVRHIHERQEVTCDSDEAFHPEQWVSNDKYPILIAWNAPDDPIRPGVEFVSSSGFHYTVNFGVMHSLAIDAGKGRVRYHCQ